MTAARAPLLLRTDANARIGAGHLMRCLTLARAWRAAGGPAVVIGRCDSARMERRVRAARVRFLRLRAAYPDPADLSATLRAAKRVERQAGRKPWLVVDGYGFTPRYHRGLRSAGYRLLVIDDLADKARYHADIVLNQNIGAEKLHYPREQGAILLLGTRYALLRPEFISWRAQRKKIAPVARKVLVTLGGSDPDNITAKILDALGLARTEGLQVTALVGASNPHGAALKAAAKAARYDLRLVRDARNVPELMAWADMALAAGGTTCWELAFMGVPSLIGVLIEHQRGVVEGLEKKRVALSLGDWRRADAARIARSFSLLSQNAKLRRELSRRGRALIDGRGAGRVLNAMGAV